MNNLYSVLKYIMLAGFVLGIACDGDIFDPEPPPPRYTCTNCTDLQVRIDYFDVLTARGHVTVTNIGTQPNKEPKTQLVIGLSTDVVLFASPLRFDIGIVQPGKTWDTDFYFTSAIHDFYKVQASVIIEEDQLEQDYDNNSYVCTASALTGGSQNCYYQKDSSVMVQSVSAAVESIDMNKEIFKTKADTFTSFTQGPFAESFYGEVPGINDTFSPFIVDFGEGSTNPQVLVSLLPGAVVSVCDGKLNQPIYAFADRTNIEITGNTFTTIEPLQPNNSAKITAAGTLSEDGNTLTVDLSIDPNNNKCAGRTVTASLQKLIHPVDLALELGSHPDGAFVGQNLKYAVTIRNNGQISAQDAMLYATVPASLTLLEPGGISCTPSGDNQVCSIPIARIDPGNSTTLDLNFDTINVKTKVITTKFELVVEGSRTLDIAPSDNVLDVSYPVTFMSDFSASSIIDLPTTLFVGEDTMITLTTTVKNAGPSSPISSVLKVTAIAPTDSTAVPNESTVELLNLAAPRTVLQNYTVNCGEVGNHSFNFTTEIQPLNPEDLDPELSNNKATTSLDVECVFPVKFDSAGWHLFSMPAVPQAKQTEKFLNEIAGWYSIVLSFEKEGLSYDPALPSFSTLTAMDGEHGYWIYMGKDGFLPVRGQPQALDTPITLEKGWNLVSYLPRTPLPVAQALVSIAGKYDKVLGYDSGATSYYPALQSPLNTLQVMERGKGYWIHMSEAGVLNYALASSVVQSAVREAPNQPQYTHDMGATSKWINIYSTNSIRNGLPLAVGTTVTAIGEDGRVLGQVTVREPGWYGVLAVYGADESDRGVNGARIGEKIRLLVNGEPTTISNAVEPIWTANGDLLQVDLAATGPEMNHLLYLPLVKQ